MMAEDRDELIGILVEATAQCRRSCAMLSLAWDELGEEGIISSEAAPEIQDTSRRLFAQAKVMLGILMEIPAHMSHDKVAERKLKNQGAIT